MGRNELIKRISYELGKTPDFRNMIEKSDDVINGMTVSDKQKEVIECILMKFQEEIVNALISGERVLLKGFIDIETKEYPARLGYDLQTGKMVSFPSSKTIKCKISKSIKDAVNGK